RNRATATWFPYAAAISAVRPRRSRASTEAPRTWALLTAARSPRPAAASNRSSIRRPRGGVTAIPAGAPGRGGTCAGAVRDSDEHPRSSRHATPTTTEVSRGIADPPQPPVVDEPAPIALQRGAGRIDAFGEFGVLIGG